MKKISIIVPCLNEEEALPVYYEKMSAVMDGMPEVEWMTVRRTERLNS